METAVPSAQSFLAGLVVVLACLSVSAFFSATETSLTSLSSLKTKHLKERSRGARVLGLWLERPHRVLAAVLILNNMVNIFASVYMDQLVVTHFGQSSLWVITSIMTVLIVLFAEIIPKTFAKTYAEKAAVPLMFIFQFFYWAIYPITWLASEFAARFSKLFGAREGTRPAPQITEEELEFLINIGEEEGVIEEQKHDMLSGIFEMGETIVREIMVPRPDMIVLSHKTRIVDAVKTFEDTGHSRIPIYEGKVDNVVGVVHAKDVLYFLRRHQQQDESYWEATVSEIKREAMFTLETKTVDELFEDLRKARQQLAIVIDEHGGTSGVVTMEDIFEEIVGEIRDEYDNEEDVIRPTKVPGVFIVDCKIHIDDFCDFFEVKAESLTPDEQAMDYDTLGGLIVHHFGQVPRVGEKLTIASLALEVTELSRRRVRRVFVTAPVKQEASADGKPETRDGPAARVEIDSAEQDSQAPHSSSESAGSVPNGGGNRESQ
jgi:putative hemolysin